MITKQDLIKEIKRQNTLIKRGSVSSFNFLGFVEKDEVSEEVNKFFRFYINGSIYYDWVNGNEALKELISEVSR